MTCPQADPSPRAQRQSDAKQFWRDLDELAGDPSFAEQLAQEFPRHAAIWEPGTDRRKFLQLMAASMALAGMHGCSSRPPEKILPYVRTPSGVTPGVPLDFATAMPMDDGAIGLVATVAFGILYLGAILGLGALAGDVTTENIGEAALAPLMTWSFWVPVVVFFLAFWLLGAFINRGRWGKWVIFGLFVGAAAYGGHILGQLFQEPFWRITASESAQLVNEQLLAPLAIAAFLFGRELTVWFGAWVARSGARKKVLNAEAQAEYERTLEAGPAALR